jgi:cation diffusion facilitator CzcD-associated flavoprotein CzcO
MTMTEPASTVNRTSHRETTIAIIGSGFAGLGMAIQLRRRGCDDFLILEKAHDIGGTWRDNTYPGCGCDVPTAIYSYSFEQNPYWSSVCSSQPEIQAYLQRLTDKYDLRRKTLFGTEIVGWYWDEAVSHWRLLTADGRTVTARYVVSGLGALHTPRIPKLSGIESFTGSSFHSARWDHSVDLTGKKVAVIGTGASAVQFVPIIAEQVGELQLYQRSPAWVLPRRNWAIPKFIQQLFATVPLTRSIFRYLTYWFGESVALGVHGYGNLHKPLEWAAKANIRSNIKDPTLAAKLTPDYQLGCKRILFSSAYYPALAQPNVKVITDGIAEIRPESIVACDGTERAVDVIIYATGFDIFEKFHAFDFRGVGGEAIVERWYMKGFQAHMGVTIAGMPNAFFLMGPNTGVAHSSIVFMIEQQIKYVLQALDSVQRRAATSSQIRQDAVARFNVAIQSRLIKRVWSKGACTNWFLDAEGVNRVLWPGLTSQYWRAVRRVDEADFEFSWR